MAYTNYKELLIEIKIKVREAQLKFVMAANSQMLLLSLIVDQVKYIIENKMS